MVHIYMLLQQVAQTHNNGKLDTIVLSKRSVNMEDETINTELTFVLEDIGTEYH